MTACRTYTYMGRFFCFFSISFLKNRIGGRGLDSTGLEEGQVAGPYVRVFYIRVLKNAGNSLTG